MPLVRREAPLATYVVFGSRNFSSRETPAKPIEVQNKLKNIRIDFIKSSPVSQSKVDLFMPV